jgi:hypothetical protein
MKSENSKEEVKQKMKRRTLSGLILFGMALLVWTIMPTAKNSDVIPLERIHTDMNQILGDPGKQYAPNVMHRVALPPVSSQREEEEALREAARNLPRLYASPAQRPSCIGCHPGKPAESWIDVFGRTLKSIIGV